MGFIRMSPSLVLAQNFEIWAKDQWSGASGITTNRGYLITGNGNTNQVYGRCYIMKGAVPTDLSTLTFSSRAADALILFNPQIFGPAPLGAFAPSITNTNPAVLSTVYAPATASGTATWFWINTTTNTSSGGFYPSDTLVPFQQIVGTVGVSGSGADLTLPSVSIIAGTSYRIFNYRLQIPTEWTF